jgi:hypothetical protein
MQRALDAFIGGLVWGLLLPITAAITNFILKWTWKIGLVDFSWIGPAIGVVQ